ncbi:MAG: hypothetical protein V1790_00860 [Planctomycetota bacterium]
MAFTIDLTVARARAVFGNRRQSIGKITGPASYTTGGETFAAGDVALGEIEYFAPTFIQTATAMVMCVYDYTNARLQAFWTKTLTPAGSVAITMTDGSTVVSYAPGGGDLKGATNPAGTEGNADQAAAPVNHNLLAAQVLVSGGNTITATVNPDVPRNVMITVVNDSGGPLDLYEGATSWLITGTDILGATLTETVTLTSTAGNKAVADTKFRYVQGVKPFATVRDAICTNPPAATLKWALGIGTRLGLPRALDSAAVADVLDITVSAARVAPTATTTAAGGVDTTNNAVNTGTTADGNDVGIIYKTDYDGAAGTAVFTGTPTTAAAMAEVGSGQNLSTYSGRFEAIGK